MAGSLQGGGGGSAASSCGGAGSAASSRAGSAPGSSRDRDRTVSFSGESGGESTDEFRSRRKQHYSQEWKDDVLPPGTSSVETNTNTNLNASSTVPRRTHGSSSPSSA